MDDTLSIDTELLTWLGQRLQQVSVMLRGVDVPIGAQGDAQLHCPAPRLAKGALEHGRLDKTAKSYLNAIYEYAQDLHLLSSVILETAERFEDVERRLLAESMETRFSMASALAAITHPEK